MIVSIKRKFTVLNFDDRIPSINFWLELQTDWQDVFIRIGFTGQIFSWSLWEIHPMKGKESGAIPTCNLEVS